MRDTDIARNAQTKPGALDFDFGQIGFVENQREFADQLSFACRLRRGFRGGDGRCGQGEAE